MSNLHDHYFRFYEYFKRTYVKRCEQWASCYRIGCMANTNMFAEAFHRLLKVVYLEGKQNRRVDTLLHTLFRIARNLIYEQVTKEEKGKLSHRRSEITKRHKKALEMNDSCVVTCECDNEWKVQSQSSTGTFYTVIRSQVKCNCLLKCLQCKACSHEYNCSCVDYALHSTVCKHIHLVQIRNHFEQSGSVVRQSESTDAAEFSDKRYAENSFHFNTADHFAAVLQQPQHCIKVDTAKVEIGKMLQTIESKVNSCFDQGELNVVKKHLQSAISSMEAHETCSTNKAKALQEQSHPAPNSCSKKQPRFFSTKSKQPPKPGIKKPSIEEEQTAAKKLRYMEVKLCSVCWKEDDNSKSSDVLWVACKECELWVHIGCIKQRVVSPNEYLCNQCNKCTNL